MGSASCKSCSSSRTLAVQAMGAIDPDDVHLSGIFVHRLVKVPPAPEGWWPMRASEIAARAAR